MKLVISRHWYSLVCSKTVTFCYHGNDTEQVSDKKKMTNLTNAVLKYPVNVCVMSESGCY